MPRHKSEFISKRTAEASGKQQVEAKRAAISGEERRRMVAEAAYFRALQRGFAGGSPEDDWYTAEAEILRCFPAGMPSAKQQKQELAAYKKLRAEVQRLLGEAREKVSGDTLQEAFGRASEEIKRAGGYSAETVGRVTESLRKDLAYAADKMGPRWEAFSDKTADVFSVWRDRGSVFLGHAAGAVRDWVARTAGKLERGTYRTGEMAYTGTFQCTTCGEQVVLKTPGHLPSCPKCSNTEFRRL